MIFSKKSKSTKFIRLDTKKCTACWKCIKGCPNRVIGKIDLQWHKHAKIVKPELCSACLSCVKACRSRAYSLNTGNSQKDVKKGKSPLNLFLVNNLLLLTGFLVIFSGLILQVGYHMSSSERIHRGRHLVIAESAQYEKLREIDTEKIVCGFKYRDWSAFHKFLIVAFSLLMIFHSYFHWQWYKGVIKKRLFDKNKLVITLSLLFAMVALSGILPWFIDLAGGTGHLRKDFIEIHDKITFVLIALLILHFIKRHEWYRKTFARLTR